MTLSFSAVVILYSAEHYNPPGNRFPSFAPRHNTVPTELHEIITQFLFEYGNRGPHIGNVYLTVCRWNMLRDSVEPHNILFLSYISI